MTLQALKKTILSLRHQLDSQPKEEEQKGFSTTPQLFDFQKNKTAAKKATLSQTLNSLKITAEHLSQTATHSEEAKNQIRKIKQIAGSLSLNNLSKQQVEELLDLALDLEPTQKSSINQIQNLHIPDDVKGDVIADLAELEKCFESECYRSATIICGRLLEIALHRTYFETTGQDILEKNPGIGLGTLIAKLHDKNVKFDPGLTQQIHLINQVRIFSVHKKKEPFYPSKAQTQAMILYTMDILEKIFKKK